MSLAQLAVSVTVASLPLLAAALLLPHGHVAIMLAWLFGVMFLSWVVWNIAVRPLGWLMEELGVSAPLGAEQRLRELRAHAGRCDAERSELDNLLQDVSAVLEAGLIVVDETYRLRMINAAALRFLGRESVARGTLLVEFLRDPEILALVRAAVEEGEEGRMTFEHRRGLWEIRAVPVRRGGAVLLISDVTLIRRSADLRRRFVQDLSHELRSPLAVLRTAVESLEGEADPESAAMLVRQVERITRLAEELRELATIESGELELIPEEIDLGSLVSEVVRDLEPVAARADVALRTEVPEALTVTTDRRALARILSNLVDNGIKYNRQGGWVEVRAAARPDGIRFEVADSGQGVPAPDVQAIFQRFYRVERGRTPGRGGLGLGLAIVKHLVQRLGGELQMDSREGVGTTVSVDLPRTGAVEDAAPSPSKP